MNIHTTTLKHNIDGVFYPGATKDLELSQGFSSAWWHQQVSMYMALEDQYPGIVARGIVNLNASKRLEQFDKDKR